MIKNSKLFMKFSVFLILIAAFGLCMLLSDYSLTQVYAAFPTPVASGTKVQKADRAEIDYSNAADGYVMVKYTATTDKSVRVKIQGPGGVDDQYRLSTNGQWDVFPLINNGAYTVSVFEQVQPNDNKYASVVSANVDVKLSSEFAPYLRPNQFVNFNANSKCVQAAAGLVGGDVITTVGNVYNWVIDNITYDKVLAQNVQSGYVPNLDAVFTSKKGICFDYSSLMTAMLRSQGIPTRLVIGYAGDAYHAWISVHSDKTGWINNVIQFDGTNWKLMDATFAATGNQTADVMKYIGDGSNYNPTAYH